jgi:hypothetical protein
MSGEFQMRPYPGAQIAGGITFERNVTKDCDTSYQGAVLDPNSLRFCDQANMVEFEGGPSYSRPYTKNFKLSGAFPILYGINLGVSYQNLGGGNITPSFRYGAAFKYPDGTSAFNMLGKSTVVPACPAAYGCVPGAVTSANLSGGAGGTVITDLFPTGSISAERIVQLDLKASKNFRIHKVTIQPAIEAFNVMNIDQIRGRQSSEVANSSGTYLQPNTMLQGRIIGFGANVKW